MHFLRWFPVFLLLIFFAGQETESRKTKHHKCKADQEETWSYTGKNGPQHWGKIIPSCDGINQSPIDIDTEEITTDVRLKPLKFINYEKSISSAHVVNNGHTLEVRPTDGVQRSVEHGGLHGVYSLVQLHFHWGSDKAHGSEHAINGRKYSMEMHLLHRNSRNETAVISLLIHESYRDNPSLQPIVDTTEFVDYRDQETSLKSALDLKGVLPADVNSFYTYSGSLTTPPCSEGVKWIVLSKTISIGAEQIQKFRWLHSTRITENEKDQCQLVDNFRSLQPLNGRPVTSPPNHKKGYHSSAKKHRFMYVP